MTPDWRAGNFAALVLACLVLGCAPLALFLTATMACSRSASTGEGGASSDAAPIPSAVRLAKAPDGFTPCSPDEGPGIDEATAKTRQAAWRSGAAIAPVRLRKALVRSASGRRRYEEFRDDRPRATKLELTLATGSVRMVLPLRMSEVASDGRGLPSAHDDTLDEVLHHAVGAVLPAAARVAFGGGWVSRGSFQGDLRVHVYALADGAEAVRRELIARGAPAIREVACSSAESGFHRAAWRVSEGARDGGGWTERLSATLGLSGCTPGDMVHIEAHAREAAGATLVVVCAYGAREHAADCEAIVASLEIAPR